MGEGPCQLVDAAHLPTCLAAGPLHTCHCNKIYPDALFRPRLFRSFITSRPLNHRHSLGYAVSDSGFSPFGLHPSLTPYIYLLKTSPCSLPWPLHTSLAVWCLSVVSTPHQDSRHPLENRTSHLLWAQICLGTCVPSQWKRNPQSNGLSLTMTLVLHLCASNMPSRIIHHC